MARPWSITVTAVVFMVSENKEMWRHKIMGCLKKCTIAVCCCDFWKIFHVNKNGWRLPMMVFLHSNMNYKQPPPRLLALHFFCFWMFFVYFSSLRSRASLFGCSPHRWRWRRSCPRSLKQKISARYVYTIDVSVAYKLTSPSSCIARAMLTKSVE